MYIWFAYRITLTKEDIELYDKILETVDTINEQAKELKINNKNVSVNSLIKYFNDVFEETNNG
jgi:hypothetical protein